MKDRKITYSCEVSSENYSTLYNGEAMDMPIDGSNTYYWHIYNFPTSQDKYKVILAFEKMICMFQRAVDQVEPIGAHVNFKSTEDLTKADFILSFGDYDHDIINRDGTTRPCLFNFDGELGILAHVTSNDKRGIHFDDSEEWGRMFGEGHLRLFDVGLHEFMHACNIGHSDVRGSVMFPVNDGSIKSITKDDQDAIAAVFSPIKRKFYVQSEPKVEPQTLKLLYQNIRKAFITWRMLRKSLK